MKYNLEENKHHLEFQLSADDRYILSGGNSHHDFSSLVDTSLILTRLDFIISEIKYANNKLTSEPIITNCYLDYSNSEPPPIYDNLQYPPPPPKYEDIVM